MQDRFYALLKRRLQTEIQRNPPLFPWEKELSEYPPEAMNSGAVSPVIASASVLMAQLRGLALPIPMPEDLLADLLNRCQSLMPSSLREGAKLVKAVEDWFPNQSPMLNQLAGMVMISPARGSSLQQQMQKLAGEDLPRHYESAVPTQQMTLSLLAAREIMSLLTVTVSPQQPQAERRWLTDLGSLDLRVEYLDDRPMPCLRVQVQLPCGGSLQLGDQGRSLTERPDAGSLSIELPNFMPNRMYLLEVRLGEQDTLVFALNLMTAG